MICPKCGCTEEDVQSKARGLCLDCHTFMIDQVIETRLEPKKEVTEKKEKQTEKQANVPKKEK